MLLDINQDMVAARQSWGGRVQYASRLPWSLPHALDDVMESVLAMVRDGNTSLLTTRGTEPARAVHPRDHRRQGLARAVPRPHGPVLRLDRPPRLHAGADRRPRHQPHQLARRVHPLHRRRPREHRRHPARAQRGGGGRGGPLLRRPRGRRACRRSRPTSPRAAASRHRGRRWPPPSPTSRSAARGRARRGLPRGPQPGPPVPPQGGGRAGVDPAPGRRAAGAPSYLAQASSAPRGRDGPDLDALERAVVAITGKNPPNLDLTKDERAMAAKVFVPLADLGAVADAIDKVKPRRRPPPDDALRDATTSPTGGGTPSRSTRPWPPRRSRRASGTTAR